MHQYSRALSLARVLALVATCSLTSVVASTSLADDGSIKLVGSGARRTALDELSYKPFDAALLGQLASWTPKPVTAASIAGKPVLIVSWASWFAGSHASVQLAQKLADDNKDLVVVLVHNARGFERAADTIKQLKLTAPVAHDAGNAMARALQFEGGTGTFYIVDRAGRLRFAGVERGSVADAVKIVVEETPDQAKAAKKPEAATSSESPKTDAPSAAPTPDDYKAAKWPTPNRQDLGAKNLQGKTLPVKFGRETWLTTKPTLERRVLVLDFWATWCPPCRAASPIFEDLQKKYDGQVQIVALSGQGEDEATVKKYVAKNKHNYAHAFDAKQTLYKAFDPEGIPHVVIISTDNTVRWQGNPHDPVFKAALATIVRVDPGVPKKAGDDEKKPDSKPKGEAPKP